MKKIYDDLWQTEMEMPFDGVQTHAYFLKTADGNFLFYNTGHAHEIEEMSELGGVDYHLLSHRHEAGNSLETIQSRFSCKLGCHHKEEEYIASLAPVDLMFKDQEIRIGQIQILATPGHTDGGISFFYSLGTGGKYLFTGDTLFQTNGVWNTLVFSADGGRKEDLRNSLLKYRNLDPDVVIWSASGPSKVTYEEVSKEQWNEIIDTQLSRLTS